MKTKHLKKSVIVLAILSGFSQANAGEVKFYENVINQEIVSNIKVVVDSFSTNNSSNSTTRTPLYLSDAYFQNERVCDFGCTQTLKIKDGVFASATDLANLQNQVSQLGTTGNPVEYNDSTKAAITLGGATGTTISNLAAGAVNASSTDAVNGAQLYATNQLAQSVSTAATAAQNTANAAGTAAAAAQTTANSALTAANTANTTLAQGMNFTGNSGTVNNAHMGDTITIKGGLATTESASDRNIRTVSNGDGSISVLIAESPKFGNVVINNGGKGGITGVSDGVLAAGSKDVVTGGQLYTTNQTVAALSNSAVQYDDASKGIVTMGGVKSVNGGVTGGTTLTNIHQGALSATSTDAVNGTQLYNTNQTVAALDGRVTNVEGDVTNMLNNGTGIKYFHAEGGAAGVDSTASGVKSVAIGQAAVASAANSVALGANSLANTTGKQVSTQTVAGTTYAVAGKTTGVVSIGKAGAERQLTNLSAGEVSLTSTDAINGSQLFATNQRLADAGLNSIKANDVTGGGTGSTATGSGTVAIGDGANASGGNVAIGHGSTATTPAIPVAGTTINNQYYGFAGSKPTETFSVGSAENPRQITNVGAGQLNANSTDAVNGSQLFATNQAVEGLGGRVNDLSKGLDSTRKEAFAGAAAAMAMQLPHTAPGKVSMGIGAGSYKGQTAGALSVKYTTKNNRFAVGGGVSYTGHGTGVNLAASWTFGSSEPAPMAQTGYDSSVYGSGYNQLNQTHNQ